MSRIRLTRPLLLTPAILDAIVHLSQTVLQRMPGEGIGGFFYGTSSQIPTDVHAGLHV